MCKLKDNLVSIFKAKKEDTKKMEKLFEIVKDIEDSVNFENVNSATFSMAIDCLKNKGEILYLKDIKFKFEEPLEIIIQNE